MMFRILVLLTQLQSVLMFQCISTPSTSIAALRRKTATDLVSDLHAVVEISSATPNYISGMSSTLLASETESWRQYVPLAVSIAVIFDILLGSPLANLALGPMRRASEAGSMGDSANNSGGSGNSLFSAFGDTGNSAASKSKERVDSEAIAKAAYEEAMNKLELRKFLEENKTNEQRYEDMRKKIDKQLDELDGLN